MKLDTRMLNLLGLLAIVAVLGLGVVSLIMPMYQGVQSTSGELSLAEQTNEGYRNQLAQLTEAEGRKAEIEKSVAELRKQVPGNVQADTVLQVIADASAATGAFIDSTSFGEPTAFTPRVEPTEDGAAPAPAPTPDPAASDAAASGSADGASGAPTDGAAPPQAATEAATPDQQIEITLTLSVENTAMAANYLDQLRAGSRTLLITSAIAEKSSAHSVTNWEGTLTVTMLAFFYESGDTK